MTTPPQAPQPRQISIEAIALRSQSQVKWLEQQALILQDDLIIAHQQIKVLQQQLEQKEAAPNGD